MTSPLQTLQNKIKEQQAQDPHIAAKIAAEAIIKRMFQLMNDGKGVHVESTLAALGALAGYTCQQMAIGEGALINVSDDAGNHYCYGDAINQPLLENPLSVWSLVGGVVKSYGHQLPDINEIVVHTSQSIGTEQFGQPRLPENHPIRQPPKAYLILWQPLKQEILDVLPVPKQDWALAYGLAIQKLIDQAKEIILPSMAANIVMECAVPMSKVILNSKQE